MPKIYSLQKQGNISDLKLINSELADPLDDEVTVKHTVIGINRFDLHGIVGTYKVDPLPQTMGVEACGIITKKGKNVKEFKVGDKVIYTTALKGSFAEERNIREKFLMVADPKIPDDILVSMFTKGLMAQCLAMQSYSVTSSSTVVVLGASGGVGHLLCQYLRSLGAKVIAVVGSSAKKAFAANLGANLIIDHTSEDVVAKIKEYTNNLGANCIYDCYGAGFLKHNIRSVAPFGIIVNYGDVLGSITSLNLMNLWTKSVYIARPSVFTYKSANRIELVLSSALLFKHIKEGRMRPKINKYKFTDIPKALKDIADNKLMGSVITEI